MGGPRALFGRYWKADSLIHRLDPRFKVLGTLGLVVIVFCAQNFWALGFLALVFMGLFLLGRIPLGQALRSILPLSFIIAITMLFNIFIGQGGAVYLDWGWVKISETGVYTAFFVGLRLLLLLLSGSLLTLTTPSFDITEAFESLLSPLGRLGFPSHEFAFIMGLALRFVPMFVDEFHQIRVSQLSRGARLSTSPFRSGMGALLSLLVPLFASVFRHADILSAALDARCYHGAKGRTRLHPLSFQSRDIAAAVFLGVLLVLTLVISKL